MTHELDSSKKKKKKKTKPTPLGVFERPWIASTQLHSTSWLKSSKQNPSDTGSHTQPPMIHELDSRKQEKKAKERRVYFRRQASKNLPDFVKLQQLGLLDSTCAFVMIQCSQYWRMDRLWLIDAVGQRSVWVLPACSFYISSCIDLKSCASSQSIACVQGVHCDCAKLQTSSKDELRNQMYRTSQYARRVACKSRCWSAPL